MEISTHPFSTGLCVRGIISRRRQPSDHDPEDIPGNSVVHRDRVHLRVRHHVSVVDPRQPDDDGMAADALGASTENCLGDFRMDDCISAAHLPGIVHSGI